jgi:hypothetical protein
MTVRDQNRFDVALTREGLWWTILVNPDPTKRFSSKVVFTAMPQRRKDSLQEELAVKKKSSRKRGWK